MEEFQEKLNEILDKSPSTIIDKEDLDKAKHLFQLLAKTSQLAQNETENGPCIEEDCSDILSPCCNGLLENKFGSLPLQVICKSCGNSYLLKDLLEKLKQDPQL